MDRMKILKYALLALGGLVVLAGALAAYVAATFDPNQYKPQIIQAVKEKTGRTLKLDGSIALSFWPDIGATVGKASLSERGSEREFAAVEEARVSLKLMPLLSKQAVVDTVRVKGLRAHIVKGKDGRTNADDIAGGQPAPAGAPPAQSEFKVDVAGVEIVDSAIQYTDQAAGTKYSLEKLNLKTGRIAPGAPTGVELAVHAKSDKPKLDLQAALKTRLAFVPGQSLSLEGMNLEAKGTAAGITGLQLKASGGLAAKLAAGEFTASQLAVAMTGASGKDNLDVRLEAPRLSFNADKASGDKVTVVAKITGPAGVTSANLVLPGVEGTAQAFRSGAMTLDLDVKRGDLAVKGRVASPVSGNIKAQQVSLPALKASLTASGPGVPGKSIAVELAGSAAANFAKEDASASLAGKVGDSNVKGQFGVTDFAPLRVSFNVEVDQLDVDRYFPPASTGGAGGAGAPGGQKPAEKPIDLSALRGLNASGKLHVGNLKANNVKASNVRLDLKAAGGRVDVNPLTANLYQGSLASAVSINAAPATPTFAVKHNMTGISIGPFLKDLANNDSLEGRGNVTLDVTSQGSTVSAIKKALNGNAAVKLANGAVRGIDIAGSIRSAKARLGALRGEQTQKADKAQKTDFSELTGTFVIRNGVASNKDLSLKSPALRVDGAGDIDIGEDTLNYLAKTSIVGTTKGQGGRDTDELKGITVPVRVTGPLAAPSYKLDFGSMVTDSVKQSVAEQLQKRLGGGAQKAEAKGGAAKKDAKSPGGSSSDRLKGLFGR